MTTVVFLRMIDPTNLVPSGEDAINVATLDEVEKAVAGGNGSMGGEDSVSDAL